MKTLCIDVGLRNLSMCIMDSDYNILLWDVYNVLDSDEHYCEGKFKNGKICNRNCNMKYVKNGTTVFTCKSHFPKEIHETKINIFKKRNIIRYINGFNN